MLKHFRHEFEARIRRPDLPTSDGKQPVPAGARG
jgi:NADH-quinone oxidoreductase subunit F